MPDAGVGLLQNLLAEFIHIQVDVGDCGVLL